MDAETRAYLDELAAGITAQVAALAGPTAPRPDAREGHGQEIGSGGSSMERQLHEFVCQVRADLGRLERRLDYLDQRLTGLDRRVTSEDARITRVASEVAGRISRLDQRIKALQQRMSESASGRSSVDALEPGSLVPLD